jgi:hypothetical protein
LERQNSDLYDLAPLGYFNLDNGGIIRRANFAAARLLGIDHTLLPGRKFGYFVSDEDRPAFGDFLTKVFQVRLKKRCNVRLGQEGHPCCRHVRIEAKLNPGGQECWIAVLDLTKQKKAEEMLRNLRRELGQRVTEDTAPQFPEGDALSAGNPHFLHVTCTVGL